MGYPPLLSQTDIHIQELPYYKPKLRIHYGRQILFIYFYREWKKKEKKCDMFAKLHYEIKIKTSDTPENSKLL